MVATGLAVMGGILILLGIFWFVLGSEKNITQRDREECQGAGTLCVLVGLLVCGVSVWVGSLVGWV